MLRYLIIPFILFLITGCQPEPQPNSKILENLDVQGHRGARGLYPENSLEGFRAALDMGVHTLELDVVMTKDAHVIVSHEPWMNADICIDGYGEKIPKSTERDYNIYEMSLYAAQNYDCGSLGNPNFPGQKKMKTYKPTLEEVVVKCDDHARRNGRSLPNYNIEIKRIKGYDGVFHPTYDFFAQVVMHQIDKLGIADRTVVQSFDIETLQYIHTRFNRQKLAYLVQENGAEENLKALTIAPDIYSPNYTLLNEADLKLLRERNIEVIPWTVNEKEEMKKLLLLGVDGIITDYPDRLIEILNSYKQAK